MITEAKARITVNNNSDIDENKGDKFLVTSYICNTKNNLVEIKEFLTYHVL